MNLSQASKIGMVVAIPLAPLATEMTIRNATEERIYDRSYRIRNNKVDLWFSKMKHVPVVKLNVYVACRNTK